jgi:hypothetical protein
VSSGCRKDVHKLNEIKFKKRETMFGLFKKKSEKEKLQEQYASLMKEAHQLSTSNRKLSDQKVFEANEIAKKIEALPSE